MAIQYGKGVKFYTTDIHAILKEKMSKEPALSVICSALLIYLL